MTLEDKIVKLIQYINLILLISKRVCLEIFLVIFTVDVMGLLDLNHK